MQVVALEQLAKKFVVLTSTCDQAAQMGCCVRPAAKSCKQLIPNGSIADFNHRRPGSQFREVQNLVCPVATPHGIECSRSQGKTMAVTETVVP